MIQQLEASMVPVIKGMLKRGDRQQDIAAFFGINAGRIAEINKGHRYPDVPVTSGSLPPPGPYPSFYEAWKHEVADEKWEEWASELHEAVQDFITHSDGNVESALGTLLLDMTEWDCHYKSGLTPSEALGGMIKYYLMQFILLTQKKVA